MLKNTPRLITLAVLLAFASVIGLQNLVYVLAANSRDTSDDPLVYLRRTLQRTLVSVTPVFDWVERVDYDIHLRSHDPGPPSPDVVVIEAGERSLQELGQFPFSRTIYRSLLGKLEEAGAAVVAFDMTFPEHDARNETLAQLRALRHEIEQKEGFDSTAVREIDARIFALDADEDFATALHKAGIPVVLGFTFAPAAQAVAVPKDTSELFLAYDVFRRQAPEAETMLSQSGNLPVVSIVELMRSLNQKGSIGHFNPIPDPDSVIRRVPAVLEYEGRLLASLSVRAAAAYYGEEPILDGSDGLVIRGVTRDAEGTRRDGRLRIPVSPWGSFLVRYYGGNRVFPYYEFSDVVKGRMSEAALRRTFGGKVVFVGVTAVGLRDLRASPFSSDYPGVEVHATIASNALMGRFMQRDHRFFLFGYLLLLLPGALVSWCVYRFHPLASFLLTAAAVAGLQSAGHFLFFNHGVVVPTIVPSLSCFALFFCGVVFRYFTEQREKKVVRAAFSRYVSGAVVEEILKDQTKLRLGGQKKELTVMFVDLVGFTRISERMDASVVTQLLNEYFTRMTSVLLRNHGTLDKYMGDGIMCFWGAPLENAEHARLACATALEMRAELARINLEWKARHGITIENRIGLHTGEMVVGNMGSDQVFSYTVMGDNVNLASRLEGANTAYGTHVLVSLASADGAGPGFVYRPLDRVQVKGREEPVDILELVGERKDGEAEPEWLHAFRTGLAHYRAREWDAAESAFGACLALKPGDEPCGVFLERIRAFRKAAPGEWSGIWKLAAK